MAFPGDGRGTFDVGVDHYECAQAAMRIDVPGANVQLFQHGITLAPHDLSSASGRALQQRAT
ncbi:MAG: hypothetical protein R3A10_05770 [Caldilineaceae bacterium]